MLKKALAYIMCLVSVSACFVSCGDAKENNDNKDNTSVTESAADVQSVPVANFTAPEKGDTVIIMNVRDYGEVRFRLFPEYAEKGVENFVELAKKGYYDGLTFHRVISDFMIQGGDPNGNGTGGESIWGGKFEGGTDPHLIHATGALAYANSGSTAANGSQFYVVTGRIFSNDDITYLRNNGFNITPQQEEIYKTVGGYPTLDGNYTVFGQVYSGLDVIFKIQNVATGANDKPQKDVIIDSVKVGEYDGEEIRWYYRDYENAPSVPEEVELQNFKPIEDGEKVITMKIEGYDDPVKIRLFPEHAEKGVENFIGLAEKGYYDGLTFHRVIKDFMIQGGDPLGTGMGGESVWGGKFEGGTDNHLTHAAGAVAYANSGSTSVNGSQFYIVTGEVYSSDEIAELEKYGYLLSESQKEIYSTVGGTPWLDGNYTIFGQVYSGLDVVFDIQNCEIVMDTDKPSTPIVIEYMTVEEYSGEEQRFRLTDYIEPVRKSGAETVSSDEETTEEETTAESDEESITEAETTENAE